MFTFDNSITSEFKNKKHNIYAWKVIKLPNIDAVSEMKLKGGWNKGIMHVFLNRSYARKFKGNRKNEKVIKCKFLPKDIIGVTRTKDEAICRKVFILKNWLHDKSQ